jgi:hypothetical protein
MEEQSPTFTLHRFGESWKLSVLTDHYLHGGRLAVQLLCEDGEPFATVSVNVDGVRLATDEFVFKTYSENEGLLEVMLAAGFVELTGQCAEIGPICRLKTPQTR